MTTTTQTAEIGAPQLTQRRILLFWLPLAASWLLMGMEMPFVNATLARLPEAERMIAAFGIVGSLSITIESPVIMLLATSTALARTRQHYLRLRQFTWHLMLGTTLLHVLMGFTPLFDVVVVDWMGAPESLIAPVRLGMQLMVPWSAMIAWRRFRQGVLIRFGQTRSVGQGTVARLLAAIALATVLARATDLPGIAVGTLALSLSVIVEAAYAHWVSRRLVSEKFGTQAIQPREPDLGYAELAKFHTPLAGSTLLYLLTQPLVSAALARLPNPETVLAAWPVASGLLFITRAPVLALPEVIIALIDENGSRAALRRFAVNAGLACAAALGVLAFTPLGRFYFRDLIGVNDTLVGLATAGVQLGVLLPLAYALQSWFRGQLTAQRATAWLSVAMLANLLAMAVTLVVGVWTEAPGVRLAALALTLAVLAETALLWAATRRVVRST